MSKEKVKSPKAAASPKGDKAAATDGDDSKQATKPPYKTDSRGDEYMAQAQKKLNKSSLLGFMSSSNKVHATLTTTPLPSLPTPSSPLLLPPPSPHSPRPPCPSSPCPSA